MSEHCYEFMPLGDSPTVENIWNILYKGLAILSVIAMVSFLLCNPNQYLNILLLYLTVSLLFFSTFFTNRYTIKIVIDKSANKLYHYYLTTRCKQGVMEIDLTQAKINYRLNILRSGVKWVLTIKDTTNQIELWQSKSSSQAIKNLYSKEQLDEIHKLVS